MSELAWLCDQLSNVPTADLPQLTPDFIRLISRSQSALSSPVSSKSDASTHSESTVQVHRLKTRLSSLLQGKSPEGRFTSAVLIKAVTEIGGWEILHTSAPWVRDLLSILTKSDCAATKEMCIITLTKIYYMTQQYATLIREITSPTMPTFISSCLNLLSPKPSSKISAVPDSLTEVIFWSFSTLIARHASTYRPFVSRIRSATIPYLAPLPSDGFVPASLKESARRLAALSHQTVIKGGGGEEWGKSLRETVKEVHVTADQVFRAVVETWESTAGYFITDADVSLELSGGGKNPEGFPAWTGISAGIQRIVGLIGVLEEYFKSETAMAVAIPVGIVMDLIERMLLMPIPSSRPTSRTQGDEENVRLRPGIDKAERDGLWSGLPQIYVAALRLIKVIAHRLQDSFITMAPSLLDQVLWAFSSGRFDIAFREEAYMVIKEALPYAGPNLGKEASKLTPLIQACCEDLVSSENAEPFSSVSSSSEKNVNGKRPMSTQDTDTFLHGSTGAPISLSKRNASLVATAGDLLPLFLSKVPQKHITLQVRGLIERTTILSKNKEAMLASCLNPWIQKSRKPLAAMLPYAVKLFPNDSMVEIMLRPRAPLVPSANANASDDEVVEIEIEDNDFEMQDEPAADPVAAVVVEAAQQQAGHDFDEPMSEIPKRSFSDVDNESLEIMPKFNMPSNSAPIPLLVTQDPAQPDADSDDESVQLVMELESDSDSE